ncbi:hypothetical protein [Sediminitomix flava]|uniref:hypothetical protein n=1 Tax=Sediminitomix flava TaxID=379075 RepID=UPI0011B1D5A0|nr:hypothetical protein [Sediminitomix flava]
MSTALSSSGIIVSKIPGKYTYVEVDEDGYEYEEVTPSKLIAFIEFDIFDGRRFKIESINYRTTEPNGKVEVKYNPKDPLDYMVDGYYLEPQSKTKLTLATSTIFFILSLFFSYQLLAEYLFNLRYLS